MGSRVICEIRKMGIKGRINKWFNDIACGILILVQHYSGKFEIHNGMPQGSTISHDK